jgi:hypothetical protein
MPLAMESPLRPDLGKILPKPWVRRLAGDDPPLARTHVSSAAAAREDFLVEVTRRHEPEADDAGFGLAQAQSIAARLASLWRTRERDDAVLHRPEPLRVQKALGKVPAGS